MEPLRWAGPEQFRFDEFIRLGLDARKDPREVIADAHALYFGTKLSEYSLVPDNDALLGEIRFEDWLSQSHESDAVNKPAGLQLLELLRKASPVLNDNEFG